MFHRVFKDSYDLSKEVNTTLCYRENLQTGLCFLIESFEYHVNFKTTALVISLITT